MVLDNNYVLENTRHEARPRPEKNVCTGSPHTFVPIIFAGNGLASKTIFSEVHTVDIALTLSKYMRIKAPSGATGTPLTEVLSQ